MLTVVKFIHLLSIAVWVGTIVFFSFFVAPSVFKVLPRETAGELIGDIFPKYWVVGYAAGVTGLVTLLVTSFIEKSFPVVRVVIITLMTVAAFYSGLSVGARARAVKAEIRAVQGEVAREALQKEFKRLHLISSSLNILVLALGVVFIYATSRSLRL